MINVDETVERRPASNGAAPKNRLTTYPEDTHGTSPVSRLLDDGGDLAHFQARVLADALSEATAAYWERRARALEDAAPRPGDWPGRASAASLEAARERCLGAAAACRARASLEGPGLPIPALVIAELSGVTR